ncbi:MAG: hypothetical protein CVU11_07965 [Bacteroidetes bacterium HGW-Bacteroidetes-6]|jgi:hypothetical protein|nr:MAG: hypothetical protein CVU11_07965 [Bacteroidetes bacterium HGW-Bacteroidetes-6]
MKKICLLLILFSLWMSAFAQKSDSLARVEKELRTLQYHQHSMYLTIDALKSELDSVKAENKSEFAGLGSELDALGHNQQQQLTRIDVMGKQIETVDGRVSTTRSTGFILLIVLLVVVLLLSGAFLVYLIRMRKDLVARDEIIGSLVKSETQRLSERINQIGEDTIAGLELIKEKVKLNKDENKLALKEIQVDIDTLKDKYRIRMKRLENDFEKAEAQFAKADKKAATKLKETRDKLETAQNALKKEFTLSLKKMSDEWQAELKKQKKTIKKVVAAKTEKEVTQKRSTTSARKVAIGKKD